MLLYTCQECGSRIVTFENVFEEVCSNCGALASAEAGLRISISLAMEDFPELQREIRTEPRLVVHV